MDAGTAPNTELSPVSSLVSILVNEQISGGNGVDSMTFATNALHVSLLAGVTLSADLGLLGTQDIAVLSGDIIISHSEAAQTAQASAAPAPASLLLVAGGLLGMMRIRGRCSLA